MPGRTKRRLKRLALRERDGDECWICRRPMLFGKGKALDDDFATLDHIVPRAKGGKHSLDNLRLAHRACNIRRADRLIGERGRFEFLTAQGGIAR